MNSSLNLTVEYIQYYFKDMHEMNLDKVNILEALYLHFVQ